MPNHREFLNTKYFTSLNGIRCLAVTFVIGFHHNGYYLVQGIKNFGLCPIFSRGYLGVQLFFVVSGFLITTILLREKEFHQTISIKLFYIKRMLRIFPIYYALLILYTIIIVPLWAPTQLLKEEFYHNLLFYMTYTNNWFVERSSAIFVFAWSLATEEQFYLVWPHIVKYFKKWEVVILIALIVILNQLANFNVIGHLGFLSEIQNHFLFRIIRSISTPICFGALLAFALHSEKIYEKLAVFKPKFASILWLIVLSFCIYSPEEITSTWNLVICFCMMLFIGSCVYQEKHYLSKILNSKLFLQVGLVSYGMYLFSFICTYAIRDLFHLMRWGNNPYLEFFASFILIFVLANISFYYYENRFLLIKKQFQFSKRPVA